MEEDSQEYHICCKGINETREMVKMAEGEHVKKDEHSLTLEVKAVNCRLPLKNFNITVVVESSFGN